MLITKSATKYVKVECLPGHIYLKFTNKAYELSNKKTFCKE